MTATARNLVRLDKQPSIRDTVKKAIRSAIISGEMKPGGVYSAPSLAEDFGVSATPIREAMLDLVREGLVVALPNRGFQVTEVSETDLAEVTELRQLLEPHAVEQAAARIPEEAFDELRAQADELVELAEAGDLVAYLTVDTDFHLALVRYGGNSRTTELVETLRSQTRLYGLATLVEQHKLIPSAREHRQIVEALAARDGAAARELVRTHIGHVLTDWKATPPSGPAS